METTAPALQKTQLTLPSEVVAQFANPELAPPTRNQYIAELRAAEWTLQAIAEASGVSRERIRQIVKTTRVGHGTGLPVPTPPAVVAKPKPVYVEPDPDKLARLTELKPFAEKRRANSEEHRKAGEDYTALIWDVHHNDKVTLYRLAKRLGVSHGALRFRLARYGYITPPRGKSKVYTPLKESNRS